MTTPEQIAEALYRAIHPMCGQTWEQVCASQNVGVLWDLGNCRRQAAALAPLLAAAERKGMERAERICEKRAKGHNDSRSHPAFKHLNDMLWNFQNEAGCCCRAIRAAREAT